MTGVQTCALPILDQTQVVAKINIGYENVQQSLPNLRLEENKIAAELQRNSINLDNQEKEIERANTAIEEIQIRIEQIKNDSNREKFLFDDAQENLSRVRSEERSCRERV